jgi:hypothetical protein
MLVTTMKFVLRIILLVIALQKIIKCAGGGVLGLEARWVNSTFANGACKPDGDMQVLREDAHRLTY